MTQSHFPPPRGNPKVIVCAGGGGVGKTTSSAAIAMAAARRGSRVLIVTIDPARRLADALGVELGDVAQPVTLSEGDGVLYALMPDPRNAMRMFVELLFANDLEALQRVLSNRMYQVMEDAVPGIHELVAMTLVTRTIGEEELDLIVIDTAPSRNALDFVTYPKRLANLLGGRAMSWLAQLARGREEKPDVEKPKGRVMKLLEKGLGPAIHDVGALSSELSHVLDRFVELNEYSANLLLGPSTRYILVAGPTGAAEDDARFLYDRLKDLGLRLAAILLNGAAEEAPAWHQHLLDAEQTTTPMREAINILDHERRQRQLATDIALKSLRKLARRLPIVTAPFLGTAPPEEIVSRLADCLEPELDTMLA